MSQVTLELYPRQREFVLDKTRFTAFVAGIGSGKTHAGCVKALMHSNDGLGLIVSPTFGMLRDSTLRTYRQVAGDALASFHSSEMRVVLRGGHEVLFRSADDPEKLRGPNISYAYIDEAALCHEMTWPIIIGRLREGGKAGSCWVTTTPKGRNWVWREFAGEPRDDYKMFRAATADNPYLAREFVASLETSYTGDFAKQELGGEFVAFEGLVYAEFSRQIHIAPPPMQFTQVIAGVDWGYTNPSVILVIGLDSDQRAFVVHEFYRRQMLINEVVAEAMRLRNQWGITAFYCDPSEPGNIVQMRGAGLNALPADNTVMPGIQTVKTRLVVQHDGRPRLMIAPECVNLAAEFESYCWKQTRAGIKKDEPEKMGDHAMDALRYALMEVDNPIVEYVEVVNLAQSIGPRW